MSETTNIAWCDSTFNPWIGCTKVSPGCDNCYAEHYGRRFGVEWGQGKTRRRTSASYWRQPVKWNEQGEVCVDCRAPRWIGGDCECGQIGAIGKTRPRRVFCGSLCDWLDSEAPVEWLADLLDLIRRTPHLNWLLLTKRPECWETRIGKCKFGDMAGIKFRENWLAGKPPPNVWIGWTAENQHYWDKRTPDGLEIPAIRRFVSVEPMLGEIDMTYGFYVLRGIGDGQTREPVCPRVTADGSPEIAQVIFGGESGPGARPCNAEWIRDGVRQCREAGVAAFVKQLGAKPVSNLNDAMKFWTFGFQPDDKKAADPSEWPEDLRVREVPI